MIETAIQLTSCLGIDLPADLGDLLLQETHVFETREEVSKVLRG